MVREDDGGNCSQTGQQLLRGGLDTAPPFPSRSGGCRDGDCWWFWGEAECYLGAAGVSAGWDEILNRCRWCSAIPASPPPLPLGWDVACLSPDSSGFISLGCIAVGAADAPGGRGPACAGGLSALGSSFVSADPRAEATCCAARQHWDLGLSLPSPTSTQVGQWPLKPGA